MSTSEGLRTSRSFSRLGIGTAPLPGCLLGQGGKPCSGECFADFSRMYPLSGQRSATIQMNESSDELNCFCSVVLFPIVTVTPRGENLFPFFIFLILILIFSRTRRAEGERERNPSRPHARRGARHRGLDLTTL